MRDPQSHRKGTTIMMSDSNQNEDTRQFPSPAGRLYFDSLPNHPPPRPGESLSSHFAHVGALNRYRTPYGFMRACLSENSRSHKVAQADFPPKDHHLTTMCRTMCCDSPQLLATTFYYLGRRFGRNTAPVSMGKFLKGSLGVSLRFCPYCIGETKYYNLSWRFTMLDGCAAHKVKLLDRCTHCQSAVPFVPNRLSMGLCSTCWQSLATCLPTHLTDEESTTVGQVSRELLYLLSPCARGAESDAIPRSADYERARTIGEGFAMIRRALCLTQHEVTERAGLAPENIRGIERGNIRQRGANFRSFVLYARALGVSLGTVLECHDFEQYIEELRHMPATKVEQPAIISTEKRLVMKVTNAIALLTEAESEQLVPVTQQAVCRFIGTSRKYLMRYEQVSRLLTALPYEPKFRARGAATVEEREDLYTQQVLGAIRVMSMERRPITRAAVAAAVGVSKPALYYYPAIRALLDDLVPTNTGAMKDRQALRQSELLVEIEWAVQKLEEAGKPITRAAITRITGHSHSCFKRYPPLVVALDQAVTEYQLRTEGEAKEFRENELRVLLHQTVRELEVTGASLTLSSICSGLGITAGGLAYYPAIKQQVRDILHLSKHSSR
jgi:transcriptional regulator with XRE-family HTH domain